MASSATLEKKFSQPQKENLSYSPESRNPRENPQEKIVWTAEQLINKTEKTEVLDFKGSGQVLDLDMLMNDGSIRYDVVHFDLQNSGKHITKKAFTVHNMFMPFFDRKGNMQEGFMPFLEYQGRFYRIRNGKGFYLPNITDNPDIPDFKVKITFNVPEETGAGYSGTSVCSRDSNKKIKDGETRDGEVLIDAEFLPLFLRDVTDPEFLSINKFLLGLGFDFEDAKSWCKKYSPRVPAYFMSEILKLVIPDGEIDPGYFAGDGCNIPDIGVLRTLELQIKIEKRVKEIVKELGLSQTPIIRMALAGGYLTEAQIAAAELLDASNRGLNGEKVTALMKAEKEASLSLANMGQSAVKHKESRVDFTFPIDSSVLGGISSEVYFDMKKKYMEDLTYLFKAGYSMKIVTELTRLSNKLNDYLLPKDVEYVNGSEKTNVPGGAYKMYFITDPYTLYREKSKLDRVITILINRSKRITK